MRNGMGSGKQLDQRRPPSGQPRQEQAPEIQNAEGKGSMERSETAHETPASRKVQDSGQPDNPDSAIRNRIA